MRLRRVAALLCGVLMAAVVLAGCEKAKTQDQAAAGPPGGLPPGQGAPMGMTDAQGPTDGNEVALKQTGLNSAEELDRDLKKLNDPSLAESFEKAFRYTFSAKQAQRKYGEAIPLVQKVIGAHPDFAPSYRVLGYADFNTGQQSEALTAYLKAVELDPNYGEAHYALAFMYAMGDPSKGKEHYQKAMALGIKDERNLGTRFYSGS
jgi:tetratricopeptide (TPR) repeat protein